MIGLTLFAKKRDFPSRFSLFMAGSQDLVFLQAVSSVNESDRS